MGLTRFDGHPNDPAKFSYLRAGAAAGAIVGILLLLVLALRALLGPMPGSGPSDRGMAFLLSTGLYGIPLTLVVSLPLELWPGLVDRTGWLADVLLFAAFVANWSLIGLAVGAFVSFVRQLMYPA